MFRIREVGEGFKLMQKSEPSLELGLAEEWMSESLDMEENTHDLRALLVDIDATIRNSLKPAVSQTDCVSQFDELDKLTKTARDAWLADQCVAFDGAVRQFFVDANFVDELHKRLRKATRRWSSWNHRKYGAVTSKEQVHELLVWELNNHPRQAQAPREGSASSAENCDWNPLERFESYCKASDNLLQTFLQKIYRPLCDFFVCDSDGDAGQEIPRKLERLVQKWDALLRFSPINDKLFSKRSELSLHAALSRGIYASYEFDSVLRLVPDLLEKKTEALRLAQRWRMLAKSHVERRGTFIVEASQKRLPLREQQQTTRLQHSTDRVPFLDPANEVDPHEADLKGLVSKGGLVRHVGDEHLIHIEVPRTALGHLPQQPLSSACDLPALKVANPPQKTLQQELDSAKMRYCTQKIKFLNARKQIHNLNAQLESSQQRCERLATDLDAATRTNKALTTQLDSAKKHVQSQVTIVEALQHQCYTLKHELDKSNIKKTELYEDLNESMRRCRSLEDELVYTRSKCTKVNKFIHEEPRLNVNHPKSSQNILPPLQGATKPASSPIMSRQDLLPDINSARSF